MTRCLTAVYDDGLTATLDQLVELTFTAGGSPAEDYPAHLRGASATRRLGDRLVIVQDDVNVLALRDEAGGLQPRLLPMGPGERRVFDDTLGNKRHKMDLEACIALPDGRLVALGSGSSTARQALVVLWPAGALRVVDGSRLYETLRRETAFSGSELNLEGALVKGEELLLFQRGNGAPQGGLEPVNAVGTIELSAFLRWLDHDGPTPPLAGVIQVDLGTIEGARLGFTDATLTPEGRIAVIAAAEASPDAVQDGPVLGCRFGFLEEGALRLTDVRDEGGRRSGLKLEGIECRAASTSTRGYEFDVVADMDRPWEPARLGRLRATDARAAASQPRLD